jgi:hypothetical protein
MDGQSPFNLMAHDADYQLATVHSRMIGYSLAFRHAEQFLHGEAIQIFQAL